MILSEVPVGSKIVIMFTPKKVRTSLMYFSSRKAFMETEDYMVHVRESSTKVYRVDNYYLIDDRGPQIST